MAQRDRRKKMETTRLTHRTIHTDFYTTRQKMGAAAEALPNAAGVLFDLRGSQPLTEETRGVLAYTFAESPLDGLLSSIVLTTPGQRLRMHLGFVPQTGATSGGYASAFYTIDGRKIQPASGAKDLPVVFLLNAFSEVPDLALALQSAGKGTIVVEGRLDESSAVQTYRVDLGEDLTADVRLSELVYPDGTGGFQPDVVLATSAGYSEDQALEAALDLAQHFKPGTVARKSLIATAATAPDKPYAEMTCPPEEHRLLAAFRIWNIIHYFFPYMDLLGEDWESVLREFIPKMVAASNQQEYVLTVAEMMTHVHDSHAMIDSQLYWDYFGRALPPIALRMIEGVPVIIRILDQDAVQNGKDEVLEQAIQYLNKELGL